MRIGNPEIKIGYIPKLKIAHGIYLGNTIVENVSGKAYLSVISTLDEEVEVQVPTLRLKPLNELFDNDSSSIEMRGNQNEIINVQSCLTHPKDIQIHFEDCSNDASSNNDGITNGDVLTGDKSNRKINESFEIFDENKSMRRIKKSRKNSIPNIHRGEYFYISSEPKILESKILGEGSYQTSPEELNNSGIAEKNFHTSLLNSTPVDCKEVNNQTSLCIATQFSQKELKAKSSTLEKIKLLRVGIPAKNYNHQKDSSHITIDELLERMQSCKPHINVRNSKENKPSSKILASTQNQSQEMIDKFMRKRKSKHKERTEQECRDEPTKNIPRECLVVSKKSERIDS